MLTRISIRILPLTTTERILLTTTMVTAITRVIAVICGVITLHRSSIADLTIPTGTPVTFRIGPTGPLFLRAIIYPGILTIIITTDFGEGDLDIMEGIDIIPSRDFAGMTGDADRESRQDHVITGAGLTVLPHSRGQEQGLKEAQMQI